MAKKSDTVYPVRFTEEQRKRIDELVNAYSTPAASPSLAQVIKFAVDELYVKTIGPIEG